MTDFPDRDPENGGVSRRSALAVVLGGAAALVVGAFGLVAGFLSNALRRRPGHEWLRVGPAEDLDAETFQRYVLYMDTRHAWIRQRRPLSVYIKDRYPDDPLVLLSTCSHLGCSVRWNHGDGHFRCPCHGGRYDEQGQVISGPPPRALTRLEVKIQDDVCFVRLPAPGQGQAAV